MDGPGRECVVLGVGERSWSWERVFVLGESSCPGRESVVLVERMLFW